MSGAWRVRWPRLSARLVAQVLAGHSAVGLALGAALYLVCLTGTLCVMVDELRLWEAPRPAPAGLPVSSLDSLAAQARALAGGKAPVIYLTAPSTPRERATVLLGHRTLTPDAQGRLTPLATPWTDFLVSLHITLTAPAPWGGLLVGFLGAGLFSLLLSGVLAHPRILRDAFILRLGGGRRLQEADVHNRLGVWGLPFHLAVTATGALFGLGNLLLLVVGALGPHGSAGAAARLLTGPAAAPDPRPSPLPPLAPLVARSLQLVPGSHFSSVTLERPGTRGERIVVEVATPRRLPRGERFFFNGAGALVGRGGFGVGGPAGLQVYAAAGPVHFGAFGGLPVRLAYLALGLALTVVGAGGVTIWLARRRDRGRPAPRLERAWDAWVWGAPLALALAALPFPSPAPDLRLRVFWGAASLIVLASQLAPSSPSVRRPASGPLRLALGAGLLIVSVATTPRSLSNPVALIVSVVTAVGGLCLVLASSRNLKLGADGATKTGGSPRLPAPSPGRGSSGGRQRRG